MNQIKATIAKAALGSGWPHGLAEDCGQAAGWLAARGFDGVSVTMEAIRPGPRELQVDETSEVFVFHAAQAARAGPSAFDLLAAEADLKCVVLRGTDQPLLIIGFAGNAAKIYGNAYRLTFANSSQVIVDGSAITIDGSMPLPGAEVAIERKAAKQGASTFVPVDIEIDDDLWQASLTLAARNYVPSSTSSRRSGAGPGLANDD